MLTLFRCIALFALASMSQLATANCGPAGIFGDNDYCVKCPSASGRKENFCPGGEVGLVAAGVANPGCSISYYYPACETAAKAPNATNSKAERKKLNAQHNAVKSGRAAITKEGDEVVVRMKQADFDKLMQAK